MTSWLAGILASVLEKLLLKLLAWGEAWLAKVKRDSDQEPKIKQVEADIKAGAKRDDETRKREKDFLNS